MDKLFVEDSGKYKEASDKDIFLVASLAAKRKLVPGVRLTGERSAKKFLIPLLAVKDYEVFCVAFLDGDRKLIAFEEIFRGTIDQVPAYPRDVFKRALDLNAASIILVHNHPSGMALPSEPDILTTLRFKVIGDALKVEVLEHFIVSKDEIHGIIEEGDISSSKMMKLMMEMGGIEMDDDLPDSKSHHVVISAGNIKEGLDKLLLDLEKRFGKDDKKLN